MRTGVIALKLGMSRLYREDGTGVPVTLLHLDACQVVGQRRRETHGYTALQIGAGTPRAKKVSKPQQGLFKKQAVPAKRCLGEFRVAEEALVEVGATLSAAHFVDGQFVDASAISLGKGFAGVMKRHNFKGLRSSHGVSVSHRSHGSTGQCQDPGRVFKGKKMAGQMGHVRVTVQNLEVVKTDPERGLIFLKGSVPGMRGGWVFLQDARKRALPKAAPHPAGLGAPLEVSPEPTPPPQEVDVQEPAQQDASPEGAAASPQQEVEAQAPQKAPPEPPKQAKPEKTKPKQAKPEQTKPEQAPPEKAKPRRARGWRRLLGRSQKEDES